VTSNVDTPRVRLRFLGTGASGGTPGEGRSQRRESSLLVSADRSRLLIDATRDLEEQLAEVEGLDGIDALDGLVLTHGHRDASVGVGSLCGDVPENPLAVAASPETFGVLRGRHGPLGHIEPHEVEPGDELRLGPWTLTAVEVPHAKPRRFRTYAWKLSHGHRDLVYASDVGELSDELHALADGADLLILDGAMYGRGIFSHLRIEEAVPLVCRWDVGRILLTQIGRTAPGHEDLERIVAGLCERAAPAYDGLELEL